MPHPPLATHPTQQRQKETRIVDLAAQHVPRPNTLQTPKAKSIHVSGSAQKAEAKEN